MPRHLLRSPSIIAISLLCCLIAASAPHGTRADSRLRAEYAFLEASTVFDDNITDYYMLLRHARHLDPDDPYIAGAAAELEIYMPTVDSLGTEDAYRALMRRFAANPVDDAHTRLLASLAHDSGRLDDLVDIWRSVVRNGQGQNDPILFLADALSLRYDSPRRHSADLDSSLALYSALGRMAGRSIPLAYKKINLLLAAEDTAAVIAETDTLLRSAPGDYSYMLMAGTVFQHLGRPDSALSYYNRAEVLAPEEGVVYMARADLYSHTGDSAAYDKEVFRALEAESLDFDQKFNLLSNYVAKLYKDSTRLERIDLLFNRLQELNPGEAQLHDFYATFNDAIGRDAEAIEQLSYANALDPNNADRWQTLISKQIQTGEYDKALRLCFQAEERFPDDQIFKIQRALQLSDLKRYAEAAAAIDSVDMSLIPNPKMRSAALTTRGDILWRADSCDSAVKNYKEAIRYDSDNYMAMNNLAYYLAERGQELDQAELHAMIATAAESGNPTFLDTYAWVEFKKKDYKRALELIVRTLKAFVAQAADDANINVSPEFDIETVLTPEYLEVISSEVFDHAGDIYFMNGEPDTAVRLWQQAAATDPDNDSIKKKIASRAYFFD